MKMAYLSYPYSDDPPGRIEEVKRLAHKIMEKHKELVLIVPHLAIDSIIEPFIDSDNWLFAGTWELELIARCDILILGCPLDYKVSPGMVWEWAFAKWLGKEIVEVKELM